MVQEAEVGVRWGGQVLSSVWAELNQEVLRDRFVGRLGSGGKRRGSELTMVVETK